MSVYFADTGSASGPRGRFWAGLGQKASVNGQIPVPNCPGLRQHWQVPSHEPSTIVARLTEDLAWLAVGLS